MISDELFKILLHDENLDWSEWSTGGGCMALISSDINTNQDYILITDNGGMDLPNCNDSAPIIMGFYYGDGEAVIDGCEIYDAQDGIEFINAIYKLFGNA